MALRKSSIVYHLILVAWAALLVAAPPAFVETVVEASTYSAVLTVLVAASAVFIAYFWLNGIKDLVYTLFYHLRLKRSAIVVPARSTIDQPRVIMVYCTYNDFSADSLARSALQDYDNYEVVILDDSTEAESKHAVDAFATEHGMRIVRRQDRVGFEAGNLNNFLGHAEHDYFVILDSDEVTPPHFISRALDYFARYNVGIAQANHVATRNQTDFMETFSSGVDSHWITYQSVKNQHGFLSLLGHGAMVSKDCYLAAGGFPALVAEDLCLAIEARDADYLTAFAPDIVCEEQYPVDYIAFKKRHSKWTQGNMEFVKRYTVKIMRSRMTWFEKLDIVLFTYSLPLTTVFSLYVLAHVVVLPVNGLLDHAPSLVARPDGGLSVRAHAQRRRLPLSANAQEGFAPLSGPSMLLYGSMVFITLKSAFTSAFNGSVFVTTPKEETKVSFRSALVASRGEIVFGLGLGLVAIALTGSVLPVLLLVVPALASVYLGTMHNRMAPGGRWRRAM